MARLIYCGRCGRSISDEAGREVRGMMVCPPCAGELADQPWLPSEPEGAVASLNVVLLVVAAVAVVAAFIAGFYVGRRTAPRSPAPSGGSPTSRP